MHSMLFVAAAPDHGPRYSQIPQNWQAFIGYVSNKLPQLSGAERLSENVWLVNLRIDPVPLGLLVAGAHEHGIAFRLLPFADEPQWLPAASGPTSTPGRSGQP
jgi:hypothetical protein